MAIRKDTDGFDINGVQPARYGDFHGRGFLSIILKVSVTDNGRRVEVEDVDGIVLYQRYHLLYSSDVKLH